MQAEANSYVAGMRWFIRTLVALFLAWAVYLVSPYVALYGLARAVEARDMALVRERVDFPALRLSLARQIGAAYVKGLGGRKGESDAGSPLGATAGAAVLAPLLEPYVSPDAVLRLIREGWPGLAGTAAPRAGSAAGSGERDLGLFDPATFLTACNLNRLWNATEWRGFRTFMVRLLQEGEPLQLQFRLSPFTWRLSGVELPAALKDRLVRELAARQV